MKMLRYLMIVVLLAEMAAAMPVQAAGMPEENSSASSSNRLSFDLICDGSTVCRIQHSSLDILNGNVIWFYQQLPAASGRLFESWISLELPDGATRGFASSGPAGGYFSVGRDGEGSLQRFLANGAIAQAVPGPTPGTLIYHCEGTYEN